MHWTHICYGGTFCTTRHMVEKSTKYLSCFYIQDDTLCKSHGTKWNKKIIRR